MSEIIKKARVPLEDCKFLLDNWDDSIQGREWRTRYVGCVTLLRTSMYVLKNVDVSSDRLLEKVVSDKWDEIKETKPEPVIFWKFIDDERHNIIHMYELSAGQGVTVGKEIVNHYIMKIEPFEEMEQRELIRKSIDWIEDYFEEIEIEYKSRSKTQTSKT